MSFESPDSTIDWNAFREIVAEVLGVEVDEVTPESNFFADLGGESIDLLDLGFQCQKAFGVSTNFQRLSAADFETDAEGRLTPSSRELLIRQFPSLAAGLPSGPFHWQQAFTIQAIHDLVSRSPKTASKPSTAIQ
jgi:acyl carrier protein